MAEVDLFEKLTLSQIARWLDIHPFDIARVLGNEGQLPTKLSFDESEVDHIRALAHVETWWDGGSLPITDDNRRRALIRSLAWKLAARPDGESSRADSLARGLDGEELSLVRRTVNRFIQDGLLSSCSTVRGLEVSVIPSQRATLQAMAEGRELSKHLEVLWSS